MLHTLGLEIAALTAIAIWTIIRAPKDLRHLSNRYEDTHHRFPDALRPTDPR